MTMECMDRQALAGFVGTILARLNQSISTISILLVGGRRARACIASMTTNDQIYDQLLITLKNLQYHYPSY